jgi:hypothetical protein
MKALFFILALISTLFVLISAQNFQPITEIGVPLREQQAAVDQWKYYQLDVDAVIAQNMSDTDSITFMVTPYSGDVDMFISKNNFPTSRTCEDCWKSVSPHGDIITIAKSDRRWPTSPAKFYIGVLARTVSVYSINTWITSSTITVFDGEPQSASTVRGFYTYFQYQHDTQDNFTIAVTPVSGDPDIYASVVFARPNSVNYTWKATNWGLDVIPIHTSDSRFVAPALYNIGVYSFTDTFFSLSVTKAMTFQLLVEGVPLANDVERQSYRYFKFYLAEDNINLIMDLNAITARGDPDMYVKYNSQDPRPSRTNYDYKSEAGGSDTLTITSARKGWYYIAVYGYSRTVFQLMATTEYKNTLLYDGISTKGGVATNAYSYYKYYHGDAESGLTITANAGGNGDIRLYLSRTNSHPTSEAGKHEYTSARVGSDNFIYFPPGTTTGNFYIGVYGIVGCNFTITAATNQSYTLLRDGEVSIFNRVPQGYYRYYIFSTSDPSQDITITANPWRGEVDLYVSATNPFPTRTNSTWRSESWRQDTVVIQSDDPNRQYHRRFYIGVYGRTEGFYSLTAYQSNTSLKLDDGVAVTGAVSAGKYAYYKFYNPNAGSVTINLELTQPQSSEADIYASTTNLRPNSYDYTWKSTKFGNDFIQIDYVGEGWIYIGVAGVHGARITYSLSVNVAHTFLVSNRASIISFTKAGKSTNFRAYVWYGCDHTLIAATLISGRTSMYVSNNATIPASETNYNWVSRSWPGNAILISHNDPQLRSGALSISVHAQEDSEYFISLVCAGTTFSLLYNSAWINEGTPRLGLAPINDSIVYTFRVGDENGTISDNYDINVRVLSGALDVFVSQNWRVHPTQNYTFVSRGQNDRIMKLDKSALTAGYVFIAVKGASFDRPTKFEITVSKESAPKYLAQDQPQTQKIASPNKPTYYRVLNSLTSPRELSMYIESCNMNSPPTIYADATIQYPGPGKAAAISKSIGKYTNYLTFKAESQMYYVGVDGSSAGSYYSIFATTKAESKPIVADRQIVGIGRANTQMALRFSRARAPKGFSDRSLIYVVYKRLVEIDGNGNPREANMETVCGVQGSAEVDGEMRNMNDTTIEYLLDIDSSKVYQINIIVHDGLGLANTYSSGWIVFGQFYSAFPGVTLFNVSVGFIIMLVIFTLFITYLMSGSIINLIRGKRGLEVIPNVEFWKDLPFLVIDGVKLVFFCRRGDSYSEFQDESHTVNTSGFGVTVDATAPTEEPKTDKPSVQSSSYGSI